MPRNDFFRFDERHPCPVCKGTSWCQLIRNEVIQCMRECEGAFKVTADKNGNPIYWHRVHDNDYRPRRRRSTQSCPSNGITLASVEVRHRVYSEVLSRLAIRESSSRWQNLQDRGLSPEAIQQFGYGEFTEGMKPWDIAQQLNGLFTDLLGVPGFAHKKNKQGESYLTFCCSKGILIPVRNAQGQIEALMCRRDQQKSKYRFISSWLDDWDGPKATQTIHVPKGMSLHEEFVRITEGPLKADVAWSLSGFPTVALPAANGVHVIIPFLKAHPHLQRIIIALDADFRENIHIARALVQLHGVIKHLSRTPEIEIWNADLAKGIDDAMLAKVARSRIPEEEWNPFLENLTTRFGADFMEGVGPVETTTILPHSEGDCPPRSPNNESSSTPPEPLPVIMVNRDEYDVNDETIASLVRDPDIFTRNNKLVRVVWESEQFSKCQEIDFPSGPVIVPVSFATLRERQTKTAIYMGQKKDRQTGEIIPVRVAPPKWNTQAVLDRASWPNLRPLKAVIDYPIFLPSGRFLCEPGYDSPSGVMLLPSHPIELQIPDQPSLEDAYFAVERIQEGLIDFPFADKHHESAWFAALLTPLIRFAIEGQAPMFLVEANAPGSGKGLLIDLMSIILRGGKLPVSILPNDSNEFRKRVTAILLRGSTMALFDNISCNLGGQEVEALITASTWSDRLLGQSHQVELPIWMTWYATANNVHLVGDMARRLCLIRLESPCERPEERSDIKIENLRGWAQQHRSRLLSAAVIILKAFFQAGGPDQKLPAWGSFESWSKIVRNALVWAGLSDPWGARKELRERADTEVEAMKTLLKHWEIFDRDNRGVTANQIVQCMQSLLESSHKTSDELEVLEAFTSLVTGKLEHQARGLGTKFRKYQNRNLGGYKIGLGKMSRGFQRWVRTEVNQTLE